MGFINYKLAGNIGTNTGLEKAYTNNESWKLSKEKIQPFKVINTIKKITWENILDKLELFLVVTSLTGIMCLGISYMI